MGKPATRFVVKRLNWAQLYSGEMRRRPGEVALASFDAREPADAECAKREAAFREAVNPFACGAAVHYWTHLDEPRLRDWLMDHGIDPPEPKKGKTDWAAWWKKGHKALGAEKRAAVWEVLDKVRFFAVREEPACPVGYAVVQVNWEYNDEFYDANAEEGEVMRVFRSRERAQADCDDSNDIARDIWADALADTLEEIDEYVDEDSDFAMFDMQSRLRRRLGLRPGDELPKGAGTFRTTDGVPFYEVIEVPLEGLE